MIINSVPCVNETKVNGRPVLYPPTETFLGSCHAFLETKASSVKAFHNLIINAQPRPQGAFPWLWRWGAPTPKPRKNALGTRLCISVAIQYETNTRSDHVIRNA